MNRRHARSENTQRSALKLRGDLRLLMARDEAKASRMRGTTTQPVLGLPTWFAWPWRSKRTKGRRFLRDHPLELLAIARRWHGPRNGHSGDAMRDDLRHRDGKFSGFCRTVTETSAARRESMRFLGCMPTVAAAAQRGSRACSRDARTVAAPLQRSALTIRHPSHSSPSSPRTACHLPRRVPVKHRHSVTQEGDMPNAWLKSNPFMSLWLSAANRIAGSLRSHATARAQAPGVRSRDREQQQRHEAVGRGGGRGVRQDQAKRKR